MLDCVWVNKAMAIRLLWFCHDIVIEMFTSSKLYETFVCPSRHMCPAVCESSPHSLAVSFLGSFRGWRSRPLSGCFGECVKATPSSAMQRSRSIWKILTRYVYKNNIFQDSYKFDYLCYVYFALQCEIHVSAGKRTTNICVNYIFCLYLTS